MVQSITAPDSAPDVITLLRLAREYGAAACALRPTGRTAGWNPYRQAALHATELCLSALMVHNGHDWKDVRRKGHDLGRRAEVCARYGLMLGKPSQMLIERLTRESLYQRARYGPVRSADGLHPNQLQALFAEVATEIGRLMQPKPASRSCR